MEFITNLIFVTYVTCPILSLNAFICNQCLSPQRVRISERQGVIDTTLCDKVCQWIAASRWFFPGTLVSSTNKADRHDITEIFCREALSTIINPQSSCISLIMFGIWMAFDHRYHVRNIWGYLYLYFRPRTSRKCSHHKINVYIKKVNRFGPSLTNSTNPFSIRAPLVVS
jgi:hypothetical protein